MLYPHAHRLTALWENPVQRLPELKLSQDYSGKRWNLRLKTPPVLICSHLYPGVLSLAVSHLGPTCMASLMTEMLKVDTTLNTLLHSCEYFSYIRVVSTCLTAEVTSLTGRCKALWPRGYFCTFTPQAQDVSRLECVSACGNARNDRFNQPTDRKS